MNKIKEPSVANTFYTGNVEDLKLHIENFKETSKNLYRYATRAVIVPHAGLVYSGRLAYEGISQIDKNVKNIFIFAPSHRVGFDGIAISSYDGWETPLGVSEVNFDICKELSEKFGANINDEAMTAEHSIEVELPIIQSLFDGVKIVPVLVGKEDPAKIMEIIEYYYKNSENAFVISSDLSHFLSDEKAKATDKITAQMIETGNIAGFKYEQACGAVGVAGLVAFANKNKFSMIRIDLANSSEITEDTSRVVGYGCWFLYEGNKNDFIAKYHAGFTIDICKLIIRSEFDEKPMSIIYPQVFDQPGACFVTIEKNGHLRGCIGSIVAYRALITDLVEHAKDAAFKDTRFSPVKEEELPDLKFSVSILTDPKKIVFENEDQLMEKIVPNEDGIIIRDGDLQAVYLPSVWAEIPDKKEFMKSLKLKAGMEENHFSDTFEAFKFHTIYIKER